MEKNKFVLKRHKIVTKVLGKPILYIQKKKFNIDVEKFDVSDGKQYLILMNHQTAGDQFFISMAFDCPVYFVASEDIFTNGLSSTLIKFLVGPIPIKKNATDIRAVKQCIRVAKEGGSIALAPEGNRTYSGATGYMNPAIVKLCKALKLPIALFKIEGGYGKMPRWSDDIRDGKMKAGVSRVITPEEIQNMSDNELLDAIHDGLYIDESKDDNEFYSKKNAEFVERFLYYCPDCGFSIIRSHDDQITCTKCGNSVRYLKNKHLEGINKTFKYTTLKEWYDAQENFINDLDLNKEFPNDDLIYSDNITILEVVPYKKKVKLDTHAFAKLYKDRIEVTINGTDSVMNFSDINAISCVDRNKLNVYHKDDVFQFKGDKRFNPLKYMHFYYKYIHDIKGDKDDKFLGL